MFSKKNNPLGSPYLFPRNKQLLLLLELLDDLNIHLQDISNSVSRRQS